MFNWDAAAKQLEDEEAVDEGDREMVLVVDDEETNRSLLRGILAARYDVLVAADAQEALGLVQQEGITAIVCDHRMPGMTGVEFFTELEKLHHPASRVMLTGYAELQSVINAINTAGIFRYLTKPIETEILRGTVKEAVHHYRIRQENNRLVGLVKGLLEDKSELMKELRLEGKDLKEHKAGEISEFDEPKKVSLTVMFIDIRGFTKFSSTTPASKVIRTLQTIFAKVHHIIYDAGGMVDKHLGDGLMAVFGMAGSTGEAAGIQATKSIIEAFPRIIRDVEGGRFGELKLSVGLAAGEVVLGMLGTERRAELAVIGQPANLASRLQEVSKAALTTEHGRQVLGEFDHAMGVVEAKLATGIEGFTIVDTKGLDVRDFPEVKALGVISV